MTNMPNFPIEFINNAKITNNNSTYVIIKATNADDKQCLVKIKIENGVGVGVCEAVTAQTNSASYSYALSKLPKNSDGNPEFNLTQMDSGRIYVSMKYPLKLYIDSSKPEEIAIIDPDGFKTRDSNYYTVYDKFEFSYGSNGLFINPTAVDFFAIPIRISAPNSTSDFKASGLTEARSDILKGVGDSLSKFASDKSSEEWSKLFLKFDESSVLRMMAPGKAMKDTGPGSNPTFASDYLANDKFGLNYIDSVWKYYETNKVKIDCSILKGDDKVDTNIKDLLEKGGYIFEGHVENNNFIFSNKGQTFTLPIGKPGSVSFFAGSQGTFDFENHTVGAIIAKELTAAFISGLLPTEDGDELNNQYFIDKKKAGQFYQDNPHLKGDGGPWYDLYSKAFSSFQKDIYTFAYGDALSEDGTLHCPDINDIGKVSVTIGDMTDTKFPDPYIDSTKYMLTVNLGKNNLNAFYGLKYGDQLIESGAPTILKDVASPFVVTFNGIEESIYIKYPMVEPYNPIAEGIVIDVNKHDPSSATVNFPGPPKDVKPEDIKHIDLPNIELITTEASADCAEKIAEKASILIIRHHQDSCDDKDPSGKDQKSLDKWENAYEHVGRAIAYYTQCNELYPIGKIVYVAGGGKQSDGHYQTPKPMDTADTIAKSLANTYRKDFSNSDSKFEESNFLKEGKVIHDLNGNSIVADYIGDNNYAGYTDITKYILNMTSNSDYKYSVLLVGDYNGLSEAARGMEVNGSGSAKKHLYEIFQDNTGSKLATPTHWDSWYGMYSLEYSKDTPRVLEKSGSTIGQKTEEGPCIDKHTHKKQVLPSDSFYYSPPTLSDVQINLIKSESTNFSDLLKKASDCTDTSCPSGIYFVDGGDATSLFNLGTKIGGPQDTMHMGETSEWSTSRYAILVGEGTYKMSDLFKLGYYTQVSGVGNDKSAVSIAPGINVLNNCAKAYNVDGTQDDKCLAPGRLDNFWRSMSDLTITGNKAPLFFAVSQASPIRDVTIEGDQGILMCDPHTKPPKYPCGETSGGFIDGMKASIINLGSQQQFYVSNSEINKLEANVWNIVSNNNKGTVSGEGDKSTQNKWNGYPFTEMKDATLAQFKKPKLVKNGDEWQVKYNDKAESVNDFIILKLNQDEDRTKISSSDIQKINNDLANKAGIIVMPGIYDLEDTLNIPTNKIVLGLGLPSLVCPPTTGKCMVTESEGVRVSGLVFDAPEASNFDTNKDAVLLNIGEKGHGISSNPTILQDVYCRIAHIEKSQSDASAYSCITVNADYTIGENLWLWRADHDAKFVNVLADTAKAPYGLVVYGNDVKMYGLFVEHFQNYQTVWFGKSGQINFYQSEMPYYLPEGGVSKCFLPDSSVIDTTPVCSSLYIAESAAGFRGQGLGIYSYFPNANTRGQEAGEKAFAQGTIRAKTAITIDAEDVVLTHGLTHFLDGDLKSGIDHIITYKSKLYPENSAINGENDKSKAGYGFDEFKTSDQTKLKASSFKKKAVNEANNKILAVIDYDKLEQKYHPDIIEKAVNTMYSHAETFQEGDMEKLAMSHEVYSKPHDYTSQDIEYAEFCIVHGYCA